MREEGEGERGRSRVKYVEVRSRGCLWSQRAVLKFTPHLALLLSALKHCWRTWELVYTWRRIGRMWKRGRESEEKEEQRVRENGTCSSKK